MIWYKIRKERDRYVYSNIKSTKLQSKHIERGVSEWILLRKNNQKKWIDHNEYNKEQ